MRLGSRGVGGHFSQPLLEAKRNIEAAEEDMYILCKFVCIFHVLFKDGCEKFVLLALSASNLDCQWCQLQIGWRDLCPTALLL